MAAVLAVVYLIFNQAYPDRGDPPAEAIRLGRLLAELIADEPEVYGLLALMLLHDSRREARWSTVSWSAGRAGPLPPRAPGKRQAGRAVLERALALRPAAGPYVLQAAIASLQAEEQVDWHRGSGALRAARAGDRLAVVAEPRGGGRRGGRARAGARAVDSLELGDYRHPRSTRAELLRRLVAGKRRGRRSSTPCGWPRRSRSPVPRPPVGGAVERACSVAGSAQSTSQLRTRACRVHADSIEWLIRAELDSDRRQRIDHPAVAP